MAFIDPSAYNNDSEWKAAIVAKGVALSPDERNKHPLSAREAAVFFDVDPQTLLRARKRRVEALKTGRPLKPYDLESVDFLPSEGRATLYRLQSCLDFFDRLHDGDPPLDPAVTERAAELAKAGLLGWLEKGSPTDTWGFSLRQDGRPVDFVSALGTSALTGRAERLTLAQYGERLAQAARLSAAEREGAAIVRAIVEPAERRQAVRAGQATGQARKTRWETPGGPV